MDREFAALLESLPSMDLADVPALRALLARRPPRELTSRPNLDIRHLTVPGRDGPPVPIRLYVPRDRGHASPGLVYCHGGGFVVGNLDSDHERCVRLAAEAGVVVVSPDYRLAPEHRYPAALDDCTAALTWLDASAADLAVDRSRLALGGTSAGGALAAGVALRARDDQGPELALLLLACPVTDSNLAGASIREFWNSPGWNGASTMRMWAHYLPTDATPVTYAAPALAASLSGLPPTEIVVADLDPLRDEGLLLGRRLAAEGVSVTVHQFADVPHGFDTLLPRAETSMRSVATQVRALSALATRT
ncbi:alpha/beta hydrolase [Sporichthya brevicatena]|uniref:Alpha/beta hydrolase n=1 Tax=Sporichthya brevicatena TaxID=171442 RepID=A0ABN1GI78_9ACTN